MGQQTPMEQALSPVSQHCSQLLECGAGGPLRKAGASWDSYSS